MADRQALSGALSFAEKYTEPRSGIPILASVRIEAGGGRIGVTATNLDCAAYDSVAANIERDGALCLSAPLIAKAVKSSSASEILLDADDRQAVITMGRSRITIPTLPPDDFPPMTILSDDGVCQFSLDAETLGRIRRYVSFARSSDPSRYYLSGTHWCLTGAGLDLVAIDGYMLSRMTIGAPRGSSTLPPLTVPDVLPEWKGEVEIIASGAFIRFKCGEQVVASKLIDGTFPDYPRAIPENPTSLLFDRDELLSAVRRMALVADLKEHSILFVGRDGRLALSARSGRGEITDEIAYDGDDFQIAITHGLASAILSSFDCETIEWRWADHTVAVTMHDPSDASRIAAVYPYRDARLTAYVRQTKEAA